MQSMANRKACDELENEGDELRLAREIDHWIDFKDESGKAEFLKTALLMGFRKRAAYAGGIQIYRVDIPSREDIDGLTHPLFRLALEFGGVYIRWKCGVVHVI